MSAFANFLAEHTKVFSNLSGCLGPIENAAQAIVTTLKNGGKILVCGNGGSAADAQHFAAELTGHFFKERRPLAALALTTDTSALTAIGNDYAFEDVFIRQVQALGSEGDCLIGISTSGNSKNVLRAFEAAQHKKMQLIGLTGETGGKMSAVVPADSLIRIPSGTTSRIQEAHIFVLHYFCETIDAQLT